MTTDTPFANFLMWLLGIAAFAVIWLGWAMRTRTCYIHSHAILETPVGPFKVEVSDRDSREKIIKRIMREGATGTPLNGSNYQWIAPGAVATVKFISE